MNKINNWGLSFKERCNPSTNMPSIHINEPEIKNLRTDKFSIVQFQQILSPTGFLIFNIWLLSIVLTSCNKQQTYDIFEDHEREIVVKNSINKVTEIEVGLDTVGNSLWKRVSRIKTYGKDGLLLSVIIPKYETRPYPITSDPLDWLKNSYRMSQTNIPSGDGDTTIYTYDSSKKLIMTNKGNITTKYNYDKIGNLIEKCTSSEYTQAFCEYTNYIYDTNNRILCKIDSTNEIGKVNGLGYSPLVKKSTYKYDEKGRIIFDGKFSRVFNDANQLIEVSEFENSDKPTQRFQYSYDKNGNRTGITHSKVSMSTLDSTQKKKTILSYSTKRIFYYYNEKYLLSQKKTLDADNNLINLFNYEYTHY